MADKIAVMNRGIIEQYAAPQEIYDRPASLFVADFIGSPPMNLLNFSGTLAPGASEVRLNDAAIRVPELREGVGERSLVLGVRPEHVRFSDSGAVRGEVYGTEYLGTTQIVTLNTPSGSLKARVPSHLKINTGERLGLDFRADRLSLFDAGSGRAIRTALHDGAANG